MQPRASHDQDHPLTRTPAIDASAGIVGAHLLHILEHHAEPLELVVQRTQLRSSATKHGPSTEFLSKMRVHLLARCLQLYPQDAQLQRGGFEHLRQQLLHTSDQSSDQSRAEVLAEIGRDRDEVPSEVLPVVINAMEVHSKHGQVQIAASRLLRSVTAVGGAFRANIVAAGALPAVCSALRAHSHSPDVVAALCELCAEIASVRNAPPLTRRAMCEALAETGVLKTQLRATRAHVTHEVVVTAACQVGALARVLRHSSSFRAVPHSLATVPHSRATVASLCHRPLSLPPPPPSVASVPSL